MPKPGTPAPVPTKTQPGTTHRSKLAAESLAERFDSLNAQFAAAEARLKALKPFEAAWINYDNFHDEAKTTHCHLLGLVKIDGAWRLVHAFDNERNPGAVPYDVTPIVECPVAIRVRAAKFVRALHAQIVEQKEQYGPKVDEAVAELAAYCNGD
jgi:hypothetical protein